MTPSRLTIRVSSAWSISTPNVRSNAERISMAPSESASWSSLKRLVSVISAASISRISDTISLIFALPSASIRTELVTGHLREHGFLPTGSHPAFRGYIRPMRRAIRLPPALHRHPARRRQHGVRGEDRQVHLAQQRARVDAQLVGEHAPALLVQHERVGLPVATVERGHELGAEPLLQRVLVHEPGQLG